MSIIRFKFKTRRNRRGQSFVELVLVIFILALLLAGVVEFGFLMESYIHVSDGAREAARLSSSYPAFDSNGVTLDPFYNNTILQAVKTMAPVTLNPNLGDDIIISVVSVSGPVVRRFPLLPNGTSSKGWSLCGNFAKFVSEQPGGNVPSELSDPGWYSCPSHDSRLTDADISSLLGSNAQGSGLMIVEILYDYPQALKLPIFSGEDVFGEKFSLIPDPIPLYIYTVMPSSSAEPTSTP